MTTYVTVTYPEPYSTVVKLLVSNAASKAQNGQHGLCLLPHCPAGHSPKLASPPLDHQSFLITVVYRTGVP
jgi:hypothetical protein